MTSPDLVNRITEFPNICKNQGCETVTVAGRCDGMSGNNSVWQNDQPGTIMVEGHPNETHLGHPDHPRTHRIPRIFFTCAGLAHSGGTSWCGIVNSPSSSDHFHPRCQTVPWETFAATQPSSQITLGRLFIIIIIIIIIIIKIEFILVKYANNNWSKYICTHLKLPTWLTLLVLS